MRRFALFSGFLGAGKTTAVLRFAEWLGERRKFRVGVITNDQATGLVDSALASNGGRFSVREIGGGCFCCKSETLVEAMGSFSETIKPQVLIGEPVGSCTDLVATVLRPLSTVYKTDYELAPLSVVVDPFRAERVLHSNVSAVAGFSQEVNYIYRKQLEEAELIVINKCDVMDRKRLLKLCVFLKNGYPQARVLQVSARTGEGLEGWWEMILTRRHAAERCMAVNYQVYAEGEARLGWVNGEYNVALVPVLKKTWGKAVGIQGDRLLSMIAEAMKTAFRKRKIEVAHLKIAVLPEGENQRELGAIQWVRTGSEPELTRSLAESFTGGRLLLNLRAEADPAVLTRIVEQAFETVSGQVEIRKKEYAAFKPAPPKPTYRMTQGEGAPSPRVAKTGRGAPAP